MDKTTPKEEPTNTEPVPEVSPTEAISVEPKTQANTPGVLILQWLTYAFWGWLIVGLIWLITVILTNAIAGADVSGIVPYAIAATIVMLPIAFVTDLFYRKHEPITKTGAATVIMVIHAVIFALLGIGALIVSVFTELNALINVERASDVVMVIVLSSLFSTLVYTAAFVRTLNPFKKPLGTRIYAFAMLGVALLLLTFAIVGPVLTTIATRNDRLIENNLSSVENAVQDYVRDNGELPANLDQVSIFDEDAESLVKNGEVKYTPEGVEPATTSFGSTYLRYQLCVTYDRENNDSGYSSYYAQNDEYETYVRTTPHDAGEVCYKLRTIVPKTDSTILE
ncbi:MAG: hypothetical protein ACREGE_01780 [Candidatus Microsaccharimonas sp.]